VDRNKTQRTTAWPAFWFPFFGNKQNVKYFCRYFLVYEENTCLIL
jgi:hypothetical protein